MRANGLVAACAVTAVWIGLGAGAPAAPAPAAHDFVLEDINPASATHGRKLALSELYAERGLILQFVASWCQPCREELPDLQALHAAGRPVVLVAADEYGFTEGILIVAERSGLTTPLLFAGTDRTAEIEAHYAHEILPATYLIDRAGTIVEVHEGAWSREQLLAAVERRLG
jgi:thiol-disulfide isomerase/thioredoxin